MPPLARRALLILAVAAAYAAAVRLTYATSLPSGAVAVWPPAGNAGRQFHPQAVEALLALHARGALEAPAADDAATALPA